MTADEVSHGSVSVRQVDALESHSCYMAGQGGRPDHWVSKVCALTPVMVAVGVHLPGHGPVGVSKGDEHLNRSTA